MEIKQLEGKSSVNNAIYCGMLNHCIKLVNTVSLMHTQINNY
jgi:hypothetical protein